jgi:hypothetical protein
MAATLGHAVANFGGYDDAGAQLTIAESTNPISYVPARVPDSVR